MAAPRKDNVKELITEALEKLMISKSFAEISTSEIASEAGISKGTLYYHFKSKDSMLLYIMDKYLDEQWQEFIDWTSNAAKDTSLPRLVMYVLQRDTNEIDMRIHFIFEAVSGNDQLKEMLNARYRKFASLIAEKISERAISEDSDLDPEYIAWLLLVISDGLLLQKHLGNKDIDIERFIADTKKVAELFAK
ncbi:MAG: TetR/AcrR family transcriptional regulator [Clostridia bacterium]|nr:TetR/AcrR family transcriptional regulator [Clostridia bacterium]